MIELRRVNLGDVDWATLDRFADRTLHQTQPWLDFLVATQPVTPVVAEVLRGRERLGWFTGAVLKRLGVRILGSPFRGWTTSYMGFNLIDRSTVVWPEMLEALERWAFRDLGCMHVELLDRRLPLDTAAATGFAYDTFPGFEIDLAQTEKQIFDGMESACRRCIRKAEKSGVTIEEARDPGFADDFYPQLQDVFAKQDKVPPYGIDRVRRLISTLAPSGNLLLLRARDPQGACIATGIFPGFNDTFYFWGGASHRASQHLRPNEFIQWYAMRHWKNRGITRYDMGGGGDYKIKYGGQDIATAWLRKSRFKIVADARDAAKQLLKRSQRLSRSIRSRFGLS